jgi:hypothetical protein
MKSLLVIISGSGILLSLTALAARAIPSPAVNLQCGEYRITLSENPKNVYHYRAVSPRGNISLSRGRLDTSDGGRVFTFINGDVEYIVTDGTLDAEVRGVLEVYRDGKQILLRNCR